MHRSLAEGHRVVLDQVDTFADGVAVKMVGEEPLRICKTLVDEVVLVDTDETCTAIKDIFEDTRSITEPSGALAVAGAKKYLADKGLKNERVSPPPLLLTLRVSLLCSFCLTLRAPPAVQEVIK